jgi:hypothetical protein
VRCAWTSFLLLVRFLAANLGSPAPPHIGGGTRPDYALVLGLRGREVGEHGENTPVGLAALGN